MNVKFGSLLTHVSFKISPIQTQTVIRSPKKYACTLAQFSTYQKYNDWRDCEFKYAVHNMHKPADSLPVSLPLNCAGLFG